MRLIEIMAYKNNLCIPLIKRAKFRTVAFRTPAHLGKTPWTINSLTEAESRHLSLF